MLTRSRSPFPSLLYSATLLAGSLLPQTGAVTVKPRLIDPPNVSAGTVSWTSTGAVFPGLFMSLNGGPPSVIGVGAAGTATPVLVNDASYEFQLLDLASGLLLDSKTSVTISAPTPGVGLNYWQLWSFWLGRISGSHNTTGQPGEIKAMEAMAKKAMKDAADRDFNYVRYAATGFIKEDLVDWLTPANRPAYWARYDAMLDSMDSLGLKVIPVMLWRTGQWEDIWSQPGGAHNGEMVRNPASPARALFYQWATEFVIRYQNRPTIKYYEFCNENDLFSEIVNPSATPPRVYYYSSDLLQFATEWAAAMNAAQPFKLLSSGYSLPRKYAEHRRASPPWPAVNPVGGSWTYDSKAQFESYVAYTQAPFDILSVHLYNSWDWQSTTVRNTERTNWAPPIVGHANPGLIDVLKTQADNLGKLLFIGEYADDLPSINDASNPTKATPFTNAVLDRMLLLGTHYSAYWAWEWQPKYHGANPWSISPKAIVPHEHNTLIQKLRSINAGYGHTLTVPAFPDVVAPQVAVSFPYENNTLVAQQTVRAVASDESAGIQFVDFQIGSLPIVRDTVFPYEATINTSALTAGLPYLLTATATDLAGNASTFAIQVIK